MKLNSRQDLEVPLDFVYAQLTDFAQFERMMMRRNAEVERLDPSKAPGPGLGWRLRFAFKGKPRKMQITLVEQIENEKLAYDLDSPSVAGQADFVLTALSPKRSRITVTLDVKPKTLPARLMIQSMRLAKRRVNRKFDGATAKLVQMLEDRWRAAPKS